MCEQNRNGIRRREHVEGGWVWRFCLERGGGRRSHRLDGGSVITRRADGVLHEQLVRSAVAILRDKLDRLVVQFKEANPSFYEEYYAARSVVDTRGGRSDNTDVQPAPLVTPTPTPVIA